MRENLQIPKQNLQIQKWLVFVSLVLFLVKIFAWWITDSVAILSDSLESCINVVAGFMGLYSLWLSAIPGDRNHPYGHGKIEFVSAGIEGGLIFIAGIFIVGKAVTELTDPGDIQKLDRGIILITAAGIINFLAGYYSFRTGRKNRSPALMASGSHLLSDAYTTIALIVGLVLIQLTNLEWIDSVIAIAFALLLLYTGYKIIRRALAGIMDEADEAMLREIVDLLNKNRRENWIDLHKMRVIKYGSLLHIDCHITVPWYINVEEAHIEVEHLEKLVASHFDNRVEIYAHTDGCTPKGCPICIKTDCPVRHAPFHHRIIWTSSNAANNEKHGIGITNDLEGKRNKGNEI